MKNNPKSIHKITCEVSFEIEVPVYAETEKDGAYLIAQRLTELKPQIMADIRKMIISGWKHE